MRGSATGQLNTFMKELVAATPPPVRGGKQPRILFATQATSRPPTFVLFTTGFLGGGLPTIPGAPIARDVRLRRQPDPDQRPHAREAGSEVPLEFGASVRKHTPAPKSVRIGSFQCRYRKRS